MITLRRPDFFSRRPSLQVSEGLKTHTKYLWFDTKKSREYIRITDEVEEFVGESGIMEGFVLVSAMHITAGVYISMTGKTA